VLKADNLPPSFAVVTKCGNLNFLEPTGPSRACNETALTLPFTVELHLSGLIGMMYRTSESLFENRPHWSSKWTNFLQMAALGYTFIYVQIKH